MGERYNIHSQLEHLQSKYIGTGHADTTKWEWLTNQHRDRYTGSQNGNGPPFRRVTLTVTVRVSRVSVMVSVRDSVYLRCQF